MLGSSISFQHTWWKQTEECFQHRRHEMEFPRSAREKQPRVCREKTKHDTGSSRATDFKPEPTWFPNGERGSNTDKYICIYIIQLIIMDDKNGIVKTSVVSPTCNVKNSILLKYRSQRFSGINHFHTKSFKKQNYLSYPIKKCDLNFLIIRSFEHTIFVLTITKTWIEID